MVIVCELLVVSVTVMLFVEELGLERPIGADYARLLLASRVMCRMLLAMHLS